MRTKPVRTSIIEEPGSSSAKIGAPARQERERAAAMKRSRSAASSSGKRNEPRSASSISRRPSAIRPGAPKGAPRL
jgi:hypothetical protein